MSLITGTQLYAWGQVYAAQGRRLDDDLDAVLSAVRDIGMDTAERAIGDLSRQELREWAENLRAHDLQTVSMYAGGAYHTDEAATDATAELLRSAEVLADEGFSVISLNPNPIGREKTDEELAAQARNLERLGRELKGMGIALGLHNHTPEMVNEAREFHHNLRSTDPELVGLCMDFHWCWRGGADPYALYDEYGDRTVAFHLRQSRDGIWTEDFREGDLDYAPLIRDLVAKQFAGPVLIELAIEQGTPQTRGVVENHRRSLEYLNSLM